MHRYSTGMNWDDLRIFLALARTGTLRRAAVELSITQPTAGRRLQALENHLGVSLFSRSRDGHRLTRAGETLLPAAEAMERSASELSRQSDHLQTPSGTPVRITVMQWPAAFLARHLPDAIARGIPIELVESDRTDSFARREADMAVRHGLPLAGQFVTKRIGVISSALYAARGYVDAHPEALTEDRYEACDWILFSEEQAHYDSMRWLLERLKNKRPVARVTSTSLKREALTAGAGLGILPCFVGDAEPGLVRVTPPIEEISADYWLIVPPENTSPPYFRRAIDWVTESFREQKDALSGYPIAAP